jgi:hypothetical protein
MSARHRGLRGWDKSKFIAPVRTIMLNGKLVTPTLPESQVTGGMANRAGISAPPRDAQHVNPKSSARTSR